MTDEGDDVVEITVPRSRRPRLDKVIVHRSKDLVPGHGTEHQRIPVTKPARVIVDLGRCWRRTRWLRFTWDQVVRRPDEVAATIAAARVALAAAA